MSLVSLIYITRKSLQHERSNAHSNVTKNSNTQVRKARTYKGMTIPENDIVVASPGMAMRLPNAFEKSERYDPDRWLRNGGGMRKTSTKFDFIGFGGGMHACAGNFNHFVFFLVSIT